MKKIEHNDTNLCINCGKPKPKHNVAFCSKKCYLENNKKQLLNITCFHCGKKFKIKYKSRKYCSWECLQAHRELMKQKITEYKQKQKVPKLCLWCKKSFIPKNPLNVYCEAECRNKYNRVTQYIYEMFVFDKEKMQKELRKLENLGKNAGWKRFD